MKGHDQSRRGNFPPRGCRRVFHLQERKSSLNKVFGQDIPGTSGIETSGYPGQKLYASGLLLGFLTRSGRNFPGFGSGRPRFGKTLCKETFGLIFRSLTEGGFRFTVKVLRIFTSLVVSQKLAQNRRLAAKPDKGIEG